MRVRRSTRSNFASGTQSRKLLNFELLESRNLLAGCNATIDSNWDTYGNGVAHTGYVPGSIGTQFNGTVSWSREHFARTAIHDGVMYAFSVAKLHAVDLQTGVDLWTREFGRNEPFVAWSPGLSFDGGNLFFVGQHRDYALLYSVNATSGEINWATRVASQNPPAFPPVVANGMVFLQGGSYGLYGVNRNDGFIKFLAQINDTGSWSPAVYGGRLFTSAGKFFEERSVETGEVLWSIRIDDSPATGSGTTTAVVAADGIAYVVSTTDGFDKVPIAIDLSTRTIRGKKGDYATIFSPAVAHGRYYLDLGGLLSHYDARSSVIYPSYSDGSRGWYESPNSQPIVTDDAVLKSSGDKTYIFDLTTRKLILTLPVGGDLSLANNTLLVSPRTGGKLFAFSLCNSQAVRLAAPRELEETAGVTEATVNIGRELTTNLPVQLSSSNPALLKLPASIVIPAGQTSITFPITVLNNLDRNGDTKIKITASAADYLLSELIIKVNDDESAVVSNVSDAWIDFNRGIARSGYFPGELGAHLPTQPAWSTTTGATALSISTAMVFTGRAGLDAHTGKLLWHNESARPGVNVDGELYYLNDAASKNQILYALDGQSGTIRWASEHLAESSALDISVTDQFLLVGTGSGIYRVDRATGIVDDTAVVLGRRSTIYQNSLLVSNGISIAAYNLNDFSLRWKHSTEQLEVEDLTASNGRVVVNTKQSLRVYDIESGEELWHVNGTFSGQPALDNDSLFAIQLGLVIQFDASTGRRVRTFEAGQLLSANQPIITDDAIIVTSKNQTYVFDRKSSQVKQLYATGGKAYLTRSFIYLADATSVKAYALRSQPALVLTAPEVLREEHAIQPYYAQIRIPHAQESDLVVALHSDLRSRLVLPDTVTIPAGQTSAEFSISVVSDTFDNNRSTGYIQATRSGFQSSVSVVLVTDDEGPMDGNIPGDWSISGVDSARSGYVPGTVGTQNSPVLHWRNQSIDRGQFAVTSRGQIFVQTSSSAQNGFVSSSLLAFDSASGKLNWERRFEQETVFSALTAADGHIYVAVVLGKELHVLAIDQNTGDLLWRFNYGLLTESNFWNPTIGAEIVVSDDVVLVPIQTIGLLALSQTSGERLYLSTFENSARWSPAVADGRVFVWDSQTFREIELKSGLEVWKKEIFPHSPWNHYSVPAVSGDTAILREQDKLVALDLKTRTVRWTFEAWASGRAVIAGDKVFVSDYDLIRTLDLKTGNALEVYQLPELKAFESLNQLNVTDDAVVAQVPSGDVLAFSRQTMELLWTFHGDSFLMNLAEDALYLLGSEDIVSLSLRLASRETNTDVNEDGRVTPVDALLIINHLNSRTSISNPRMDVNSDGRVTPSDALLVINLLNSRSATMNGEGEISTQLPINLDQIKLDSFDRYFELSFENNFAFEWALRHKKTILVQQ